MKHKTQVTIYAYDIDFLEVNVKPSVFLSWPSNASKARITPLKNGENYWGNWQDIFKKEDSSCRSIVINLNHSSYFEDAESPELDFTIRDKNVLFSNQVFREDFSLSEWSLKNDVEILFEDCIFEKRVWIGYCQIGASITFNRCKFKGHISFEGRSYEKGLYVKHCEFVDTEDFLATIDLTAIYYGTLGTCVYLTGNKLHMFVDFFDSSLKTLVVTDNFFLKGHNLFSEDNLLDYEALIYSKNMGELELNQFP